MREGGKRSGWQGTVVSGRRVGGQHHCATRLRRVQLTTDNGQTPSPSPPGAPFHESRPFRPWGDCLFLPFPRPSAWAAGCGPVGAGGVARRGSGRGDAGRVHRGTARAPCSLRPDLPLAAHHCPRSGRPDPGPPIHPPLSLWERAGVRAPTEERDDATTKNTPCPRLPFEAEGKGPGDPFSKLCRVAVREEYLP